MSITIAAAIDPQPCPVCGRPVLVRRVADGTGVIILESEPSRAGTWMVTPTTAQTITGRGGWRYEAHALTCRGGVRP